MVDSVWGGDGGVGADDDCADARIDVRLDELIARTDPNVYRRVVEHGLRSGTGAGGRGEVRQLAAGDPLFESAPLLLSSCAARCPRGIGAGRRVALCV